MLIALIATIAVQAQSLTDKNWFADMSDKENDITLLLTFDDNNECAACLKLQDVEEMDEGAKLIVKGCMLVPGTYTLQGKKVKMVFDTTKGETKITADIEGMDEVSKSIIMSLLRPEMEKMKPELEALLIGSFPTNDCYEITKLTVDELQFDGGFDFIGKPK